MKKMYILTFLLLTTFVINAQLTWVEPSTNAQVVGQSLVKIANNGVDCSATSLEVLPAERNGYIEYTLSNNSFIWSSGEVGVSNANDVNVSDEIDYAVSATSGFTIFDILREGVSLGNAQGFPPLTPGATETTIRFERQGDELVITRISGSASAHIITLPVKAGDLVADVKVGGNGGKQINAGNVFLAPNPIPYNGDQDWLESTTNTTPQNIDDFIYTNGRVGINYQVSPTALEAMLYVNIPDSPDQFDWGYNTVLDVSHSSERRRCRDNLLLRMKDECEHTGALIVEHNGIQSIRLNAGGDAYVRNLYQSSDRKFKSNIKEIVSPLELITKLEGKTYDLRLTPESELTTGLGFIAQDVQKIMPDIVKEFEGSLAIDYTSLIPVLTEAIKEQQKSLDTKDDQIEELTDQMEKLKNTIDNISDELKDLCENGCANFNTINRNNEKNINSEIAWLGQNFPNPHSGITSIDYFIPSEAISADLVITDLQGKMIKKHVLNLKSDKIEMNHSNLSSGLYIYTLVVDQAIVDSKRMIIEQ